MWMSAGTSLSRTGSEPDGLASWSAISGPDGRSRSHFVVP